MKDAVTGSIPAHARLASDNRTGIYGAFFDDAKTVPFRSYLSGSAVPGFNARGQYPNYGLGENIVLWWRFEDKFYQDGRYNSDVRPAGVSELNYHSASWTTNNYEESTDLPTDYSNNTYTFPNTVAVAVHGNSDGDDTIYTDITTISPANSDELTTDALPKFTVSLHFKLDDLSRPLSPLVWRGIRANSFADWELLITSAGAIEFGVFKNANGVHRIYHTANSLVSAGQWQHIAVTLEASGTRSNITVKIYLNGTLRANSIAVDTGWGATQGANPPGFTVVSDQLYVGAGFDADYLGGDVVAPGLYDQVVIANKAATADEVSFLYLGSPIPGTFTTGVAMPAGLYTSNPALLRREQDGEFVTNEEMTTDIVVSGIVRKGIGDTFITFTPGQDFQPFRDDGHPDVDAKSVVSGATQNPFYATGSKVSDVGEGFNQPLWSKSRIEIDLTPATEHSFSFHNGSSGSVNLNYPVAYWNHERRQYEGIGTGKVFQSYTSGSNEAARFIKLKQLLEDQCIAFGESLWEVLGSPNPQLNESRGHPVSNWGFPYHPKFHATSSNSIPVSDYINEPFLVEKVVLEFSGAFGVGGSYASRINTYTAAVAGFFVLNQRSPYAANIPDAQQLDYATSTNRTFMTGAFVPGEGALAFNTTRDLVTTLRIASIITGSFMADEAASAIDADLTMMVPFGSLSGSNGPPVWSRQLQVSGTVRSAIANQGMQSIITNTGVATTFMITKLNKSNRSGLFGTSGRSLVSDFSTGEVARSVTTDGFTYNVLKKYTKANPYLILPGDRLVFGWQPPWSRILNADTLGVLQYSNQGTYLRFAPTPSKIILYGSKIKQGKEHHDTLNQLLTSVGVHEVIE